MLHLEPRSKKPQNKNFGFYFQAMFSSKTGRCCSYYYCLFLLVAILLVKNQVPQYEKAQRKGSGLIRANLNSSNASICTKFITALRTLNPKQRCCRDKLVFLYLCSILVVNSYAPEPNPGPRPIKFPCIICEKAV